MAHAASSPPGAVVDGRFVVPADAPYEEVARAAVEATSHAQARARDGAWSEAAAALRASVSLRERLVRAEAAGPPVTARGWYELAIACLALGHDDEARALIERARAAVALAEPGLVVDGLRDTIEDTWARIEALDASVGPRGDAGLRPDGAPDAVMAPAAEAPSAPDLSATAASGAPWVEAWSSHTDDEPPPRQATPETALSVIPAARPIPMPELPDAPSAFVDELPAADETALTFLRTSSPASGPRAADGARGGFDASFDLDDAPPTFDPWGTGASAAGDDDIEFLTPTVPHAADTPAAGAAAHPPAEAALAGAARPRAKVVLPEFPPEPEEKKGLLSRILRRSGR